MPEQVEIVLEIPPELGDHDDIVARLRVQIAAIEAQHAAERVKTGRRVLGRRRVLRQSWRDSPDTFEPRRNRRPRVAARSKWARVASLQRNREWLVSYREARARLLAGKPVVFPLGTYWLRVYANVPTEPFVSRRPHLPT
jgi:hypothetical protein